MNAPLDSQSLQPDPVRVRDLEVSGEQGVLRARLYAAGAPSKRDTLVVFFPGGAFVRDELDESDSFLRRMVSASTAQLVLASNYTLATARPFPSAVEDAHAVLLWAKKNKTKLGWNGKRMIVAGIEAGANLAAVCALMSRDRGAPKLDGQILLMPMLDPGLSSCSMRAMTQCPDKEKLADGCAAAYRDYLPNAADRTHPYASPLQSSRLKNLPPALILSAEDDPLRDEAEAYGAKLASFGVAATVLRLLPAPVQAEDRNECACEAHAQVEIARFIASLGGQEAPPG
ncbi:alpha/beta hydrolase [Massilia sp. Dwa41.01b]|uniref:alpha/beta hydrolase n=1 Tax=unclassified Massilia TaxID=2609279 RepID=UPI0016044B9D|nr:MULTISPECIES: alpha/beta hydrolase [unclassified Massilia]QNA90510.1 alpha/beta hydrolase [Massilia sp. Dwa41.01b]QNA97741.1 alpha/beta hydrolase [Massilia sp. Se16.2.3]